MKLIKLKKAIYILTLNEAGEEEIRCFKVSKDKRQQQINDSLCSPPNVWIMDLPPLGVPTYLPT